jgi:hypothetical protein
VARICATSDATSSCARSPEEAALPAAVAVADALACPAGDVLDGRLGAAVVAAVAVAGLFVSPDSAAA